jgi:hypothetical protein
VFTEIRPIAVIKEFWNEVIELEPGAEFYEPIYVEVYNGDPQ